MKNLFLILGVFFSVKISHPVQTYWSWTVYKVVDDKVAGELTSQNFPNEFAAKIGWNAYVDFFGITNWSYINANPIDSFEDITNQEAGKIDLEHKGNFSK